MYDKDNVFAKIIRGEIPCKPIYENKYALAFRDIKPMFETHVLVIPRGEYKNILDFTQNASDKEQSGFWDCFIKTAEILGINNDFNIVSNAGANAPLIHQTVFHMHMHLTAGKQLAAVEEILAG